MNGLPTHFALHWLGSLHSEQPHKIGNHRCHYWHAGMAKPLTQCKQHALHSRHLPSSNTRPAFNHSVRSGKVLRWRRRRTEEKGKGLVGRVMEKFYRSSQCCLEHGQRLKTQWSACVKWPRGTGDSSTQLYLSRPEENHRLEMTKRWYEAIHCSRSK